MSYYDLQLHEFPDETINRRFKAALYNTYAPIPFSVYMHLLSQAASQVVHKYRGYKLKPGEVRTSTNTIAKEIGREPHQVKKALERLRKDSMLRLRRVRGDSVYFVVDYEIATHNSYRDTSRVLQRDHDNAESNFYHKKGWWER